MSTPGRMSPAMAVTAAMISSGMSGLLHGDGAEVVDARAQDRRRVAPEADVVHPGVGRELRVEAADAELRPEVEAEQRDDLGVLVGRLRRGPRRVLVEDLLGDQTPALVEETAPAARIELGGDDRRGHAGIVAD